MKTKVYKWFMYFCGCAIALALAFAVFHYRETRSQYIEYGDPELKLIEEIAFSPESYDGSLVRVICYIHFGVEGIGLGSSPPESSHGNSILARASAASYRGLPKSHFEGEGKNTNLMLVEGYVHKSGYDNRGTLIDDEPYIEIRRMWQISGICVDAPIDRNCATRVKCALPN